MELARAIRDSWTVISARVQDLVNQLHGSFEIAIAIRVRHHLDDPEIACYSGYTGDSHSQWESARPVVGAGFSVQAS